MQQEKASHPGHYFPYVDLVRLAAATMVMLFHDGWMAFAVPDSNAARIVMPMQQRPSLDFSFGWVGVEIFFVISGLVIANSAATSTPIAFVKGRLYRIYPMAWVCATISALIYAALGQIVWSHYRDTLLLLPIGNWISPVYWTLGVELMFYFLVFLWKLAAPGLSLQYLAIGLLGWSAAYLLCCCLGWQDKHTGLSMFLLLRHGAFFALGTFLSEPGSLRRNLGRMALMTGAIAACIVEIGSRPGLPTTGDFLSLPVAIWIVFAAIIAATTRQHATSPFSGKMLGYIRVAGLMTYPIYLLHYEVGNLCLRLLLSLKIGANLGLFLTVIIVFFFSFLIVVLLERRMRLLLKCLVEWVERKFILGNPRWQLLYKLPVSR